MSDIYRYRVENLRCAGCVQRLNSALAADPKIEAYDADADQRRVSLTAAAGLDGYLREQLAAAGYPAASSASSAANGRS